MVNFWNGFALCYLLVAFQQGALFKSVGVTGWPLIKSAALWPVAVHELILTAHRAKENNNQTKD